MISVVMPVHNHARFISRAVESVWAQDRSDVEVLIVDDGSTDDPETVVNALSRDGDVRFFQQENAGAASARNRGIAEASGEWIAFLDADDVWLPGKLAAQFDAMEKGGADFSFTDSRLRFENGEERELPCPVLDRPLMHQLLTGNLFGTPTVVVRRRCFEIVGLFDEQLRTGEDWDMWLRLASAFTHVWVQQPLSLVRATSDAKFPVVIFEQCTRRVLERLFSCKHLAEKWAAVHAKRRLIYAWHYSVLAKSYLRERRVADFCRLASQAIASHPAGLEYLVVGKKPLL
jgi:glycosyltransferase involved in cell wall biosynthesis